MSKRMKQLFCRISKVDEEARTVTGIGASEALDADGEIFDYDTSKPYIEGWSDHVLAASKGKSYGNIREMHQASAVGKLAEPITYDDLQKLVILTAYIGDESAWQKCLAGIYTGFSICGPIIGAPWSDPLTTGAKRYTCKPVEFSICDLPCNPQATFTAVKADGVVEQRRFQTVEKEADVATKKAAIKAPIVTKSLYSIGDLAELLSQARWIQDDAAWERESEGDGSPVPDSLKSWIADGIAILVEMAREEGAEAVGAMKTRLAALVPADAAPIVVAKVKKTPLAKATTALGSMGECIGKTCKCQGIEKCMTKIAGAHQDATDAVRQMQADADAADDKTDDKKTAGKAVKTAAGAAVPEPIPTPGAGPETEESPMDEAQKAQLALAEKNSAEALALAKQNNTLLESVAKALGSLTVLVAGEPMPAKSAAPSAVHLVTKAAENGGQPADLATAVASKDPLTIAKAIMQNGKPINEREMAGLNIGR